MRSAADIDRLPILDPEVELRYVIDAVRLIRRELGGRVPLIGFAGSPWTVATYVVEGGGSKAFARIKAMLYGSPAVLHRLLAHLTRTITDYLNAQIRAGAQAVMVFDTWGGALTPAAVPRVLAALHDQMVAKLAREHDGRRVPVSCSPRAAARGSPTSPPPAPTRVGVDWTTDLGAARAAGRWARRAAGQSRSVGAVRAAAAIREQVGRVLASYGAGAGHVFNLGHGIHPDVPARARRGDGRRGPRALARLSPLTPRRRRPPAADRARTEPASGFHGPVHRTEGRRAFAL